MTERARSLRRTGESKHLASLSTTAVALIDVDRGRTSGEARDTNRDV